jgi:hypothetical protein
MRKAERESAAAAQCRGYLGQGIGLAVVQGWITDITARAELSRISTLPNAEVFKLAQKVGEIVDNLEES